jgi:hypothetical protein
MDIRREGEGEKYIYIHTDERSSLTAGQAP